MKSVIRRGAGKQEVVLYWADTRGDRDNSKRARYWKREGKPRERFDPEDFGEWDDYLIRA